MNNLTLAEVYKNNKIGINLVRYVLALLVIVDHSYHMGGFGEEPLIFSFGEKTTVGFIAVGAFFSISGFLITNAALNSDPLKFFLNRFLRIWPALIFLLLVSAFLIGPIIVHFSDGSLRNYALNFNSTGPWTYIFHNIFLYAELQYNLFDTFQDLPNGSIFNGSLWTLPLELRAYLLCLFLVIIGKKFGLLKVFIFFQIYSTICIIGSEFSSRFIYYVYPDFMILGGKFMFTFFFAGMVAIVYKDRQMDDKYLYFSSIIFVVCCLAGGLLFQTIGISTLVFIIPLLARKLKLNSFVFFRNDISYGTYIWGYLVGQTLFFIFKFESHEIFLLSTILVTTIIAIFSWFAVEKPALDLKNRNFTSKVHRQGIEPRTR
jgi:peptidoglycan/LPS O-acetylase OafA/YrhL